MKIDILKKTNIFHYFPSKNLKYSQIFLSETIHAQENGSRGPHFAKSLNSNFLKGLTYSALEGGQFRFWSNLKVPFMYTCGINHFFRIFNPTIDD